MASDNKEVMDKVPVPFLQDLLEEIAKNEGFDNPRYAVSPGSETGDNYIGVIYRAEITGRRRPMSYKDVAAGKKGDGKLSVIMKAMPQSKERKYVTRTTMFFGNEITVYNDIIPYFIQFQEEKGVPEEQRFKSVPKCYRAVCDGENDALILEDMRTRGFQMKERRVGLDAETCCLVLRELAKYHAFSFALRDQRPDIFDDLKGKLIETIFDKLTVEGGESKYRKYSFETALKLAAKITHEGSEQHEKLKRFCDNFNELMYYAVRGDEAEPYAVITHGDCWTNNFLFKFTQGGITPEAVCFLDFQLARYSSPVLDISYLIYCGTTRQTRKESYSKMISEYYESLSKFLRLLGSDPDKLFPESALQDHLKKYSKFGLAMALLAMILFTTDEALNMDDLLRDSNETAHVKAFKKNDIYEERMGGVILDMVEHGFI